MNLIFSLPGLFFIKLSHNMRGISSIIGALIFLQILLISLVLIVHFQNNEDKITISTVQRFHDLEEVSPIMEFGQNSTIYLYSLYPIEITHIIYPNGEIINKNMTLTVTPVEEILNDHKWAVIITNQGTWFNVTDLSNLLTNPSVITFPQYKNYGEPIGGIVRNVNCKPNWNYLGGMFTSDPGYAIIPVNVTIGNSHFSYGLTGAEVAFIPQSQWINLTLLGEIQSYTDAVPINLVSYKAIPFNILNSNLSIYVPINVSWIDANNKSDYTFEYTSLYFGIYMCQTPYSHGMAETILEVFPPTTVKLIYSGEVPPSWTPFGYFKPSPTYYISGTKYNWGYPPSSDGFLCDSHSSMVFVYSIFCTSPYNFTVYQIDLNLQKGITLVWTYAPSTVLVQPFNPYEHVERDGNWLLIYNYTWVGYGKTIPPYNYVVSSISVNTQQPQYPTYIVVPEGTYLLEIST